MLISWWCWDVSVYNYRVFELSIQLLSSWNVILKHVTDDVVVDIDVRRVVQHIISILNSTSYFVHLESWGESWMGPLWFFAVFIFHIIEHILLCRFDWIRANPRPKPAWLPLEHLSLVLVTCCFLPPGQFNGGEGHQQRHCGTETETFIDNEIVQVHWSFIICQWVISIKHPISLIVPCQSKHLASWTAVLFQFCPDASNISRLYRQYFHVMSWVDK